MNKCFLFDKLGITAIAKILFQINIARNESINDKNSLDNESDKK